MKTIALGDVVDFYSGGTPSKSKAAFWQGDVPWFSAKDMKRPRLSDSADHVAEEVFSSTSLRKLPAGTIVMVVRGMILAHTVPISILDVDAAINQDLKALLPKREVDSSFLAAMLRAQHTTILSQVGTAAHGTKKLDSHVLENLRIPFPPLPEQRRIAAILDHADALRAKRREVLGRLDSLTQSIFHSSFGDLHSSRWAKIPFGDAIPKVDNGTSPNCETRPANDNEWGVLKLGAVTYGYFQANENKAYVGEIGRMTANEVKPGDVLMTRKNTRDLVGAVALVDHVRPRLLLPDLIFRLHLDPDRVDRRYFHALMMNPQKRLAVRDLSSGSASSMPNISKARLAKLPLELPPLSLQKQFASKVENVEALRPKALDASAKDDVLFASLQSRAFRGEL